MSARMVLDRQVAVIVDDVVWGCRKVRDFGSRRQAQGRGTYGNYLLLRTMYLDTDTGFRLKK